MPGFFVLGVEVFAAAGRDVEGYASFEEFLGEDVEGVLGDDEEIDVGFSVGLGFAAAAGDGDVIGVSGTTLAGGFDLDAGTLASVIGDEVGALLVAEGAVEREAELGGAEDEGGFAEVSDEVGPVAHVGSFGNWGRAWGALG